MPSPFTSTFASAAAGNSSNESASNGRNVGRGESTGDWSRSRPNGATQTFRRPSLATGLSSQRETPQNNNSTPTGMGVYVPPHLNSSYQSNQNRNGSAIEGRYSKDQLLDLFRAHGRSGQANNNVSEFFVDGWNPEPLNGTANGGWGKKDEFKDGSGGPEICWDFDGSIQPLGLVEMGEDEKEIFMTSVNSPLKPPAQNTNKDNPQSNGVIGRRTSLTQAQNNVNNYPTNSPSARPGARRRESTDLIQNSQLSPSTGNNRFSRDDSHVSSPPPSLLRRRTDFKESPFGPSLDDKEEVNSKSGLSSESTLSFGTLKRTATVPAGNALPGPSSPWAAAPQSAGFSPMGAFGNFTLGGSSGQPPTPSDKKSTFSSLRGDSLRGESRFKGLMNTDNSDDSKSKIKEKASISSLEQLSEATTEPSTEWGVGRSTQSRGAKPYQDDEHYPTGSAALGGDDASPPRHHASAIRSSDRQMSYDDIGLSSLGLSSEIPPFREIAQRRDFSQGITSNQPNAIPMNEPMSPTVTNPYQSPEAERAVPDEFDTDDPDSHSVQFPGSRPFSHHARGLQNQHESAASDRSQTSSAGAPRAFPALNTLGALSNINSAGPWSNPPGAIGTPTRAIPGFSSGFVDSTFSPLSEVSQTPNAIGTNSSYLAGGPSSVVGNTGLLNRGSKMGSLFPNAMQEQMRGDSLRHDHAISDGEPYQRNIATSNAPGFGATLREIDSPLRPARGMDDLFGNADARTRSQGFSFGLNENQSMSNQLPTSIPPPVPLSAASSYVGTPSMAASAGGSYFGRTQDQDASNQMPASQQRQMVMPDRMRWIYRDPQGNTQGPWSGLEMHDWYKAGFFSPELQVKKLEDADYEPLAQLIRRIGNSREPFLVPQIGIPHGSSATLPSSNASVSGSAQAGAPSTLQSSSAQPPFAGSFPSFGTTLTAEQQNALERRKQEEQYLMARQKEHLAQQQVMIKQMQHMQGASHGLHGQQLHHHSSAHSLQSQPSYGSITSPVGYQPSPAQGPIQPPAGVAGFFDPLVRNGPLGGSSEALGPVREDDVASIMNRINTARGSQLPVGGPPYAGQQGINNPPQVEAMLQERARIQREQEHYDLLHRNTDDHREMADRLDQFHLLRSQIDEPQQFPQQTPTAGHTIQTSLDADTSRPQQGNDESIEFQDQSSTEQPPQKAPERLSLSEQVQKAAALAKQSPSTQPQSPWAKVESGLPQPFPPPQSSSPLPAPAAQRNRQNVADALTAESRSRSQTPSVETPSTAVAPWAKETIESSKGPSLKDIQAMEARKQQEQIAAAARRALAEQERQNLAQPTVQTPGLPSSANWASGVSPAVPMTGGISAWMKPAQGKIPAVPTTAAKKTLAQIQKEEEARKSRDAASAAASAASNLANNSTVPGGKRYADLAGKAAASIPQLSNTAAWTTVGAGGKVKTPIGPAPSLNTRVASGGTAQSPVTTKPKATIPLRGMPGSTSNQQSANDEFQKWARNALGKGLNSGIPIDDFVSQLLILPPEPDIISDSIYASSQTLDGRRFAEEFVRRRKLADKGIIPDSSSGIGATGFSTPGEGKSGGWSEVAKKGPAGGNEVKGEAFKVVGGKKKGRK